MLLFLQFIEFSHFDFIDLKVTYVRNNININLSRTKAGMRLIFSNFVKRQHYLFILR